MILIGAIDATREILQQVRADGKSIGFVPTMGAFHEGHLSLMRRCGEMTDYVVVSIFVNPLQFDRAKDLDSYPVETEADRALAEDAGVDMLFTPDKSALYPSGFGTFVTVEGLTDTLCGASRPGHFRGVTTVVAKLLNIVQPDLIVMGMKDCQQACIIKKMLADLNMPTKLHPAPTVREPDGLAMSSRNALLAPEHRDRASIINETLRYAQRLIDQGERNADSILKRMTEKIRSGEAKIDYISIVHRNTLQYQKRIDAHSMAAVAVFFGSVRLIDNILFKAAD